MDLNLTFTSFLQIIAVPAYGVLLSALVLMWKRMQAMDDAAHKRVDEAHDAVAEVRAQVGAWQLETFKTFATKQEIADLRSEMRDGFREINTKLDRMIALSAERARA